MRYCPICKKVIERSFCVPQDDKKRERWSKICGVQLNKNARVCMDHFPASSIITTGKRFQLLPFAEPVETKTHLQSIINEKQQSCIDAENYLEELSNDDSVTTNHTQKCYEDLEIQKQIPENDDSSMEFKCGEIFCYNFKDLRISCDFCKSKQFSLEDFFLHLQNIHLQDNELKIQSVDCLINKNLEMQVVSSEEDEWIESFEEVHTLVEKDDANYISEDNEIIEDHYNEDEIDGVAFHQEDYEENIYDERCEEENEDDLEKKYQADYEIDEDNEGRGMEEDLIVEDDDYSDIESSQYNYDVAEYTPTPLKDDDYDGIKDKSVKRKRKRNRLKKEPIEFQCPECPEKSNLKKHLDNHVFENHGGYKCSKCDKRFRLRQHLITHEQRHNLTLHSCTVNGCNKVFADIEYCKRHIENHNMELKFKCPYENCGKGFLTLLRLKLHNRVHLRGGYVRVKKFNYVCDICGYSCQAFATLKIHQRMHTGEKPFSCDICGNRYITQSALNKHKISHSDERKFKCDICGTKFKSKEVLGRHKFLHSERRQFKCSFCGKDFKQPHCRDTHIREVHKGIKHKRAKRKRQQKEDNTKIAIEILDIDNVDIDV